MKTFTLTALVSVLSVAGARDVYGDEVRVLDHLSRRNLVLDTRASTNLATFTGALGGVAVTAITCSGDSTRQFEVNGDTFVGFTAAAQRSCDVQNNACANLANSGEIGRAHV